MKVGNKIRVDWNAFGYWDGVEDYVVEEYRHTLGIFRSKEDRIAGKFTPLCGLYYPGPESQRKYLSNYGEYTTNLVQGWGDLV